MSQDSCLNVDGAGNAWFLYGTLQVLTGLTILDTGFTVTGGGANDRYYGVGQLASPYRGVYFVQYDDPATSYKLYLGTTSALTLVATLLANNATYRNPQGLAWWLSGGTYYLAFISQRVSDSVAMLHLVTTAGAAVANYPKSLGITISDDSGYHMGCIQKGYGSELLVWLQGAAEGVYGTTPTLDAAALTVTQRINTLAASASATGGAVFTTRPNGDVLWVGCTTPGNLAYGVFATYAASGAYTGTVSTTLSTDYDFQAALGNGSMGVWYNDSYFYVGCRKDIGGGNFKSAILICTFAGSFGSTRTAALVDQNLTASMRPNQIGASQFFDPSGAHLRGMFG